MIKPRVLLVHNFYQRPGGEDVVFAAEKQLLLDQGHAVFEYTDTNRRIGAQGNFRTAVQTIWSRRTYAALRDRLRELKPDLVHFHNTFLLISPSAYVACRDAGIPVVQTLHNYRLICPAAILFREGRICHDCVGRSFPYPSVQHACYRHSRMQTAIVAGMLSFHNLRQTWQGCIDRFIALSRFSKSVFVQAGFEADRISVKPNFLISDLRPAAGIQRSFALFVGRLSEEKGVRTLLGAWDSLGDIPLTIAGEGPEHAYVQGYASLHPNITFLGYQSREAIFGLLPRARFLVFPSVWYENFPVTLLEAFACGTPVIASHLGALPEIVSSEDFGLLVPPADPEALAQKARWLWDNPEVAAQMGEQARRNFHELYSPEKNYQQLMEIYSGVLK